MSTDDYLNCTGKHASPCSERALKLAEAILTVQETKADLDKAMNGVPSYTGQHDPQDYYQDEQQAYYNACAALDAIVFPEQAAE